MSESDCRQSQLRVGAGRIGPLVLLLSLASYSVADGQCPQMTTTQPVERVVNTGTPGRLPSLAIDGCGRLVVAWEETPNGTEQFEQINVRFMRFDADGNALPYAGATQGAPLSELATPCALERRTVNTNVSIAMGRGNVGFVSPSIYATWTAARVNFNHPNNGWRLRVPPFGDEWRFDDPAAPFPSIVEDCNPLEDQPANSAAVSDGITTPHRNATWPRLGFSSHGLLAEMPTPTTIRNCDFVTYQCFGTLFAPCVATRSNGESVLVWCEPERPADEFSPMNVFMMQFGSDGNPIPATSPMLQVNTPDPTPPPEYSQDSPSVAFDDVGNIVVVFRGPDRSICDGAGPRHVYARRFTWGGPTTRPVPVDPAEVQVDSDHRAGAPTIVLPEPTVSLTNSTVPTEAGKFFVAWNTTRSRTVDGFSIDQGEIHGQFFNADGTRWRGEFRVNQDNSPTESSISRAARRYLAKSAQHTAAYGPQGQIALAWTEGVDRNGGAHLTILPAPFTQSLRNPCLDGDISGDGLINGSDIQPFVDYFVSTQAVPSEPPVIRPPLTQADLDRIDCAMDMDRSGAIGTGDIPVFIWLLMGRPTDQVDCNSNCTYDYIDIARDGVPDCNGNAIPDACDIASGHSQDANSNGIPDECEEFHLAYGVPDCNTNNIDDAEDIASQTSEDCNSNGSPDECESLDCNTNGILDDCETAGGQNDCNSNFLPDECDLLYGPSFDCNTNGVPDECDIADATSEDSNSNGIPDECEEQQGRSMMGGDGDHSEWDTGETPVPPSSAAGPSGQSTNHYAVLPVKWQALMHWIDATDFSAMSPEEIDAAMAGKMVELGLLGG
ncbi:MAG: hypothetical protein U1A27_03385 [Phycisphaerae bacterium]